MIIPIFIAVAFFTVAERKIMGAIQRRRGPNVIGFMGLLQALADGLKLFVKETTLPSNSNLIIFLLAPMLSFILSLISWAVIPFSKSLVITDAHLGVLYLFSISSLNVYGILLAGWSSNSKYAYLGALRSAAQMISYEISISFIVLTAIICAGSFNLSDLIMVLLVVCKLAFLAGLILYAFLSAGIFLHMAKRWSFKVSLAFNYQQISVLFWAICYCLLNGSSHEVTFCMNNEGGAEGGNRPPLHQSTAWMEGVANYVASFNRRCLAKHDHAPFENCHLINNLQLFEETCNREMHNYYEGNGWWGAMVIEPLGRNESVFNEILAKRGEYSGANERSIALAVQHVAQSGENKLAIYNDSTGRTDVYDIHTVSRLR